MAVMGRQKSQCAFSSQPAITPSVTISRPECLAHLAASTRLLDANCRTIERYRRPCSVSIRGDREMTDPSPALWAQRGSKLQLQLYVNRRPGELIRAILAEFPELAQRASGLGWRAPLESARFAEPRDRDFLAAIGCEDLADELAAFWPARGPVWDGLAVAEIPDKRDGVVLVEAKSHPQEVY
jgi:hypothetical protein